MIRLALVTLLVVVLVLALLWLFQRRLIYFPDRGGVPAAASVLSGARDVVLTTSDGLRLGAWLMPPTRPGPGVTVLYAPGNGGNRLARAPLARALAAEGLSVLLMEYRGYGGNPGSPTEAGLARDVRAARDYLVGTERVAPDRIIYFGESLGSAVVTELATTDPPAGLLLRSPFIDLAAAGRHLYPMLPVSALLRDRFPVAELIGRVKVPTVIVYGTADTVVPAEQSRAVAARAGGPIELIAVDGADHNDPILFDGPLLIAAVTALADRVSRSE